MAGAVAKSSRLGFIRKIRYEETLDPRQQELLLDKLTQEQDRIRAEQCRRHFFYFIQYFWSEVSNDAPIWNWHIPYIAERLERVAEQVASGQPREKDLIINIPPGTTKSTVASVMFPAWCWIKWYWMRFIASSYSGALSLEHAELSRDIIKSEKFKRLFPHLQIKPDKEAKSNFKIQMYDPDQNVVKLGGNRYSTSVGGTLTGFHGHILIVDDPLDPNRSVSDKEIKNANHWIDQTLSTRKINKAVTPTIVIMQRLHQNDPTGHIMAKKKNVEHICLPGEIRNYAEYLNPPELASKYQDDLLDPVRMPWTVLKDMEADLGQYGYAGQVGQNPTPPGGGMFKVDHFQIIERMPAPHEIQMIIRYWDKAATIDDGCFTVGVKKARLVNGQFLTIDVKRGQWSSEEREAIIKQTARADGSGVIIWEEQEPGSGGKESAEATIRSLAGFSVHAERPSGNKVYRADPYSVQVNNGNVLLLRAPWNYDFIEEHRNFPFGIYKDQVDAAAAAFARLVHKRIAGPAVS